MSLIFSTGILACVPRQRIQTTAVREAACTYALDFHTVCALPHPLTVRQETREQARQIKTRSVIQATRTVSLGSITVRENENQGNQAYAYFDQEGYYYFHHKLLLIENAFV
jgi:hypothetical protein